MTPNSPVPLILSEAPLQRFRFGGRVRPRGGVALVVRSSDGRCRAVEGLTPGESVFGPSATQYEVDVAEHLTMVEVPVRSRDDAYAFQISVEMTWHAHDPAEVVRRRVADGAALVVVAVRDRLREMARSYAITGTREFEQEIRTWFQTGNGRLIDGCLIVGRVSPEVGLDQMGTELLRKVRAAEGDTEVVRAEQAASVQREQNAGELARMQKLHELERQRLEHQQAMAIQQDEEEFQQRQRDLQAERAEMARRAELKWNDDFERQQEQRKAESERNRKQQEAEFARQQAEWQAEHDRRMRQHEVEAQWAEQDRQRELEKQRTQDFVYAIERGDAGFLAIYLGQHPQEAGKIVDLLMRREEIGEERRAKMLADLFDQRLINESDLEGSRDSLTAAFLGMITRPASGLFRVNTTVEVEAVVTESPEGIEGGTAEAKPRSSDG
jgi:hypothetical protein